MSAGGRPPPPTALLDEPYFFFFFAAFFFAMEIFTSFRVQPCRVPLFRPGGLAPASPFSAALAAS